MKEKQYEENKNILAGKLSQLPESQGIRKNAGK